MPYQILPPASGGTGVKNTGTITLGGSLVTSGAFGSTFTMTGTTSVTFPTSGTLATTAAIPSFPLSLANGGTNANLTANNGGIFYSTATAGAILAGTATANQALLSGATGAPAWSTATFPATTTVSQILYSSATNTVSGLATANNGVLITSATGVPSILANGTTGQVFTATTGSPPGWAAAPAGGIPTIGSSTDKSIVTWSGTGGGTVQNNANLVTTAAGEIKGGAGSSSNCTFASTGSASTGMYFSGTQVLFSSGGFSNINFSSSSLNNNSGTNMQGFVSHKRTATATSYTVQNTDYIIAVTSTAAARTITLPDSGNTNAQCYVIKDESGAAATNNISVTVNGGTKTIDGVTTYVINTNYGSITVYYATNYFII